MNYAKGSSEHMEGLLQNGKSIYCQSSSIAGLLHCVTTVGGDSAPARGNP